MKRLIYVFAILFLLVSSCEKPPEKGEYGNPLLKFYGDAKEDIGYSIAETADGYVICGKLTIIERELTDGVSKIVGENQNFGLIKTDRNGNQQWVYNAGSQWFDEGRKVLVLNDGSFVCVGTKTMPGFGLVTHTDVFVTKISSSGQMIWEKTYGNYSNQRGFDILQDQESGGFIVVGSDDVNGGNFLILTIDSDGNQLDSDSQQGTSLDEFARKVVFFDGEYYVIGETGAPLPGIVGGLPNTNIMIVQVEFNNLNNSVEDPGIYGTERDDQFSDAISFGSELAIVGTITSGVDSKEGLFVKFGPGVLPGFDAVDFSIFDFPASSNVVEINSITLVPGVGLMAAGTTGGTDQSGDMLFMFLDNDGNNISYPKTYITGGTGLQTVYDAIIDSEGKVVAVGINSYESNSLITLIKFDPRE